MADLSTHDVDVLGKMSLEAPSEDPSFQGFNGLKDKIDNLERAEDLGTSTSKALLASVLFNPKLIIYSKDSF